MANEGERLGAATLPRQWHHGRDLLPQAGTYAGVPHRVRRARARSALTSYTPLRSHSP